MKLSSLASRFSLAIASIALSLVLPTAILADTTTGGTLYGAGDYGACQYQDCPITLTSSGAVSINLSAPTASGSCTVQSDAVSVLTDNTPGYTLQVANSAVSTAMLNGANSIPASAGTAASPASLAANAWGYRVDGLSGFGAGPTTAQSNISAPIAGFAGIPASNATAATLATTATAANPAVTTTVWYGVCANSSLPSGTYSSTVTYTAVAN